MQADGPRQFGFQQRELALLCASHNGEDQHVAVAQGMLDKAGLTYKALRCGCHVPGRFTLLDTAPPPDWFLTSGTTTAAASTPAFWPIASSMG